MLELWGRKNANQVIQVLWTLSELGVEFKRNSIGTEAGDLETREYKTLNPNSKIPTIRDNGFVTMGVSRSHSLPCKAIWSRELVS